ncbi:MAG TPA: TolC family protein [bacterium]
MNRILKSLLLLLALMPTGTPAAERLTLDQAVARAAEASEELRSSELDVAAARWQVGEAASRRLPQLEFSGQYLFTSDVMSIVQAPMTIAIPPVGEYAIPGRETKFGDNHTVDFKLQLTQPLFTGFRLSRAHRAAQHGVSARQAESDRVRWEVQCRAEEAYVYAQKSSALSRVAALRVSRLERHLEDARNRFAQGVAPQEAVDRAQLALSQAQLKQQEADHADRLAQIALRELLDLPQSGEDLLLDSLQTSGFDRPDLSLNLARSHRAEFRTLEAQNSAAVERIGVERAAYYPSVAVFGAVDYGRPGIDKIANEWMLYEVAGVNLTWTLWDWKIRRSRVEQMRAAKSQVTESQSALESRLLLELESAKLNFENARQRLTVASEGQRLAENVLKWVNDRYSQGVATEKEYLDAQDDFSTSQMDYIIALADLRLAQIAAKLATGSDY